MANRLADSTSPYLLQHEDNPVDWWPWCDEAFAAARERGVPVLLSVGYAACHWCHVMAHESFEDAVTAAYLNEHFVCVKVDREERPDVDAVYMEATTAMTGHGGWPMTCFLTPAGEPFFCGTYFPPAPRPGMPSFRQVLESVARAWVDKRAEVEAAGADVVRQLSARGFADVGAQGAVDDLDGPVLDDAVAELARTYDRRRGGFGGAPKFPPSMCLEQLLRHAARTGDGDALRMAEHTCEAMARGGIYDQVGGGFARYSVDAEWVVPHFEKMLYDNALLMRVYAHLWRQTGSELARRVAVETADFVVRELRTPEGGLASALDADSEGEEGRFYVWSPEQLRDALGEEDGAYAAGAFGVTPEGTFEHGRSVLRLPADPADPQRFAAVRRRLAEARERRVRPARDDKVVAAWNGLAIAGLAEVGVLLDRPDLVAVAVEVAALIERVHLGPDGRLARTSRAGVAGRNAGVLEDYGDVAEGLLALYSATAEPRWVGLAGRLLAVVLERFGDGRGGFYDTASDAERLMRRPQDPADNAAPSGASAAAGALLTYAGLTESPSHREAAEAALRRVVPLIRRHPRFAGWSAAVAEALLAGPAEVAVVGPAGDPRTAGLVTAARRSPAPGAVLAVGEPGSDGVPLLAGKPAAGGTPTAYVCRHFVCGPPQTDPDRLAAELSAVG